MHIHIVVNFNTLYINSDTTPIHYLPLVCFLSKFQQALVEMETPQAASAVVMYSKSTPVFIRGKEVHFEYSKSQNINTSATPKSYHALEVLSLRAHTITLNSIFFTVIILLFYHNHHLEYYSIVFIDMSAYLTAILAQVTPPQFTTSYYAQY
jgi:hypothetical protein